MNNLRTWHKGSFGSIMPRVQIAAILLGALAIASPARAQFGLDLGDLLGNLGNLGNILDPTPSSTTTPFCVVNDSGIGQVATWNSAIPSLSPLTSIFNEGSQTWNGISVQSWTSPVSLNCNTNSQISLTGTCPVVSTLGAALNIGNLCVSSSTNNCLFNLANSLNIDGDFCGKSGTTSTVTCTQGGLLNLLGNCNAGTTAQGLINLCLQNNCGVTLGNNNCQTFGQLTIDSACSTLNLGCTGAGITTKTCETFTGGLNINSGSLLCINGWQGSLGKSGACGELFFANVGQALNCEVTNCVFDLATNQCGVTCTNYVANNCDLDYGMWITCPTNSCLCELVPYCCVPEPKTILAGLALLGAICWVERRRLAALRDRLFAQPLTA
jgi:hypothetical protein